MGKNEPRATGGGIWKEISAKPRGRILEAALQAILKVYGVGGQAKDKGEIHIESMLSLSWKRKRGSVIGLCINTTPEKMWIEKGFLFQKEMMQES